MKREFLQNFKIGEQALPKEVIDAIMEENGRDIEAEKGKFADYETLKAQLVGASTTIEGFKALDVDGVKAAAEDWKQKYEQAQREADTKIADMAFDGRLTGAVTASKGRSAKAISALLDVGALKSSKNQEADIKAALEAIKQEHSYLFDTEQTPPPYAAGTGTQPVAGGADGFHFGFSGIRKPTTNTDK